MVHSVFTLEGREHLPSIWLDVGYGECILLHSNLISTGPDSPHHYHQQFYIFFLFVSEEYQLLNVLERVVRVKGELQNGIPDRCKGWAFPYSM